jgi:hypothetical protein
MLLLERLIDVSCSRCAPLRASVYTSCATPLSPKWLPPSERQRRWILATATSLFAALIHGVLRLARPLRVGVDELYDAYVLAVEDEALEVCVTSQAP